MEIDFKEKQQKIMSDIYKIYNNNRLIPFVGAGFSKNISPDFPAWTEYIGRLLKTLSDPENIRITEQFAGSYYTIDAAEFFALAKFRENHPDKNLLSNSTDFRKIIKKILIDATNEIMKKNNGWDYKKSLPHRLLAEMFPTIYTTNWDTFIEDAMEHFSGKCRCIYSADTFVDKIYLEKMVVKIHGSLGDENMIISTIDYLDLLHNNRPQNYPLSVKFQNEVFHNNFLFLGFSFTDPNITNILYPTVKAKDEITEGKRPKLYMINFGYPNETLFEYYQLFKQVYIFFIDALEDFKTHAMADFLLKLKYQKLLSIIEKLKNNPADTANIIAKEKHLLSNIQLNHLLVKELKSIIVSDKSYEHSKLNLILNKEDNKRVAELLPNELIKKFLASNIVPILNSKTSVQLLEMLSSEADSTNSSINQTHTILCQTQSQYIQAKIDEIQNRINMFDTHIKSINECANLSDNFKGMFVQERMTKREELEKEKDFFAGKQKDLKMENSL